MNLKTIYTTQKNKKQVGGALRTKHYSYRTEQTYVDWIKRYIIFHNKRHPNEMGENEICAFIACFATERKVAASTHTALVFGARETRHSAPFFFIPNSSSKGNHLTARSDQRITPLPPPDCSNPRRSHENYQPHARYSPAS
jgi:hypothetical protein